MNALTVVFGGSLGREAFEPLGGAQSAFSLALEKAAAFPGTEKLILLGVDGVDYPGFANPVGGSSGPIPAQLICRPQWTAADLLETLAKEGAGCDCTYYAWADSPFLDPALAGAAAVRHTRFQADYSYADGWPRGFAPELLAPGTAGILCKIAGEAGSGPVERDTVFRILQKDINSFDIETEISPVDLRYHRLSFTADSKRNLLLLRRFAGEGLAGAAGTSEEALHLIAAHPEFLRTLPAFYAVQAAGPCPAGSPECCAFCPYPGFGAGAETALKSLTGKRNEFLDGKTFAALLDKIEAFSGDAVIDLSLWGELSLHPRKEELVSLVLSRPALSLVIETTGLLWKDAGLLAEAASAAPPRKNGMAPLTWIVSLGQGDIPREGAAGEGENVRFVRELLSRSVRNTYVQAVRTRGSEDTIEQFYRSWKALLSPLGAGDNIIIQKYDSFCGFLPERQAVDLSPVKRRPCWHLLRDMTILLDGTVPVCREDLAGTLAVQGNAFTEDLESIWARGEGRYLSHCSGTYEGICAGCDEYYTYNF